MTCPELDDLLEEEYWIVDILPERVPKDSRGQYFAVEQYYLQEPRRSSIHRKYMNILLKLNCYFDMCISEDFGESWVENPEPEDVVSAGSVYAYFKDEGTLIVINEDDTYMTVYDPSDRMLDMIRVLAAGEGVFVWKG